MTPMIWDMWKKGFYAWENSTAQWMEHWLKSPLVLGPSDAMLSAAMRAKAANNKATAQTLSRMGLPTRQDQERVLHALNQIQSRLIDLEEKIEDLER